MSSRYFETQFGKNKSFSKILSELGEKKEDDESIDQKLKMREYKRKEEYPPPTRQYPQLIQLYPFEKSTQFSLRHPEQLSSQRQNPFVQSYSAKQELKKSHRERPTQSAHLKMQPIVFQNLKFRVNQELIRQGTNIASLQKKINACKITSPHRQCRKVFNDKKLSPERKMQLYRDYERENRLCSSYREMMEKAFAQEIDPRDKFQQESYQGHKWQKLQFDLMAEKCQNYQQQLLSQPDTFDLGNYLKLLLEGKNKEE
jgi:hypothetical protein